MTNHKNPIYFLINSKNYFNPLRVIFFCFSFLYCSFKKSVKVVIIIFPFFFFFNRVVYNHAIDTLCGDSGVYILSTRPNHKNPIGVSFLLLLLSRQNML